MPRQYLFFGVYFQHSNGTEYRCGFRNDIDQYQPLLEKREGDTWIEINYKHGTGKAGETAWDIREELPFPINFDRNAHTQNQRMELINQIVYNINRHTNEGGNYGGAHT